MPQFYVRSEFMILGRQEEEIRLFFRNKFNAMLIDYLLK